MGLQRPPGPPLSIAACGSVAGAFHGGGVLDNTIGKARRSQLSDPLPGQAYVGRPSPLGHPFQLGRDGSRTEVIARYRRWLWSRLQGASRRVV